MGLSINGRICFGVLLEEGAALPWDDDNGERDVEDWWRDQTGFVPSKSVYDGDGEHLPGVTPKNIKDYWNEIREWDRTHPVPVQLVNVCSGDCPIYIIAIPSTIMVASWGTPEPVDPDIDFAFDPKLRQGLDDFLGKYGIEHENPPQWYLSSCYMG